MSLMNDMIKDSDKKHTDPKKVEANTPVGMETGRKCCWKTKLGVLLGSLFVIFLTFQIAKKVLSYFQTPLITDTSHFQVQWPVFSRLLSMSTKTKNDAIQVLFRLSKETNYHLKEQPEAISTMDRPFQNEWILKNVKLDQHWQPLDRYPEGILGLSVSEKQRDVHLQIALDRDFIFSEAHLMDSDAKTLVLTFKQRVKPTEIDSVNNKMIKSPVPIDQNQMLENQYQSALKDIQGGQWKKSESILKDILKKSKEFVAARVTLISLQLREKHFKNAMKEIQKGLSQYPAHPELNLLYARWLVIKEKFYEAISVLQAHSPPITENESYYAYLAGLYQKTKQYEFSSGLYEQLLQVHPDSSIFWLGYAISLESQGQKISATEAYRRALLSASLNPQLKAFVHYRLTRLQG